MRPCLALLPMLLATAPAWADADTYRLDPVHTRVLFSIDHAGYSQAMGTVSGSEGRLQFDPDNWREATLDVEVPVSRLTLAMPMEPGHAGPQPSGWRAFPEGTFRLQPGRTDRCQARPRDRHPDPARGQPGDHAGRDPQRHQALPPPPFRRTAGFSASTTLSRRAFGITAWPGVIGDAVQLRIEAEATLDRSDAPGTPLPFHTPTPRRPLEDPS